MHLHQSTELALKQFDANAALSSALANFQACLPEATIIAEASRAAEYGFSWFARPSGPGYVEVRLLHSSGAYISAEGTSVTALLAGLLGHPLYQDIAVIAAAEAAAESEQEKASVAEAQCPVKLPLTAQVAAESLAAATGGTVVEEGPRDGSEPTDPLTDQQKAVCVEMIKDLTPDLRKAFAIAFRDAFRVPREAKAIAPLITQVRHLEFCDRWSIEAAGGVAP
jgi:hypothetical protein